MVGPKDSAEDHRRSGVRHWPVGIERIMPHLEAESARVSIATTVVDLRVKCKENACSLLYESSTCNG